MNIQEIASELLQYQQMLGVDEYYPSANPQETIKEISQIAIPQIIPAAIQQNPKELAAKATTIEELREICKNYDGCELKKTATNHVFYDGIIDAKIMIIGEAPGAEEDMQGIPFCGNSGKLLDKMLAAIGLSRKENVYITNSVYWRPPANRRPTNAEIEQCLPFLQRQIELLQPEYILLLGATATKALLDSEVTLSKLRRKLHDFQGAKVQVSYHPSYLLRTPEHKKAAWQDLLFMKERITPLL